MAVRRRAKKRPKTEQDFVESATEKKRRGQRLSKEERDASKPRRAARKRRQESPPCTCGYCGGESTLAFAEADPNWELPGHPDHFSRDVGHCCSEDVIGRTFTAIKLTKVVERRLRDKPDAERKLAALSQKVFPDLPTPESDEALLSWAAKVGVETGWTQRRASA